MQATGYCRLFYIKNWQQIQRKRGVLKGGQLESYIAEIASKYPDKYLEAIRSDLADVGSFQKVVTDLDLDLSGCLEAAEGENLGTEDAVEEGLDHLELDDES
jgi:hypothetical protein